MTATSSPELQRLLEEAPFVRALASALAARDADDVVQGTWLRVVENGRAVRQPRPWLARVVRSVAGNLRRGSARRAAREHAAARSGLVPSSAELMEREERRRELVQAVDALPEPLRAVVLLRWFEDLPPRVIATRLGVPVTTVWNRLRTALALLRKRLDERHGDRRAWLLPLLPAALTSGVLAMTAKAKVAVAAGALVLAALALWTVAGRPGTPPPGPGATGQPVPPLTAEVSRDEGQPAGPVADAREDVTPAPAPVATTGTLIVQATYADDGAPVPDLVVLVGPRGGDHRLDPKRMPTDARGIARFEDLAPGRLVVWNTRQWGASTRGEVIAGGETMAALVLPTGIRVTGVVVDRDGVPVAGAEVHVGPPAIGNRDVEHVATTGVDGRFAVRSCDNLCLIGARADGHAPSRMQLLQLGEGESIDVKLVLPGAGGTVAGLVFGPEGHPVADALVVVGEGSTNAVQTLNDGAAPVPAQVRTDAEGRFRAIGIPEGEQPLRVRAAGWAPWSGSCTVVAFQATTVQVTLGRGLSIAGSVVDADGAPVSDVDVAVGDNRDFAHWRAETGTDGSFAFHGLPPGEVEVRARHDSGKARRTVHGGAGETVRCELRLDSGLVLRGRVLGENDEPVARARVAASASSPSWYGSRYTDSAGRFSIPNCPEGRLLDVEASGSGFHDRSLEDVDPRAGELVIRLAAAPPASVRIVGTLLGADGRPVEHAEVLADERGGDRTGTRTKTGSGAFEIGPVVPGNWRVWVLAHGEHPAFLSEWRVLGEGAEWDLGTIRLPLSGKVVAELRDEQGLRPRLVAADATLSRWTGLQPEGDAQRVFLAPGLHYVTASGRGVASELVPVDVRAGEVTRVVIHARVGYRQRFRFEAPVELSELHVRVSRGDEPVAGFQAWSNVLMEWQRWLAPGDYMITASGDGQSGRAAFTVREGDNEVVRILLR